MPIHLYKGGESGVYTLFLPVPLRSKSLHPNLTDDDDDDVDDDDNDPVQVTMLHPLETLRLENSSRGSEKRGAGSRVNEPATCASRVSSFVAPLGRSATDPTG